MLRYEFRGMKLSQYEGDLFIQGIEYDIEGLRNILKKRNPRIAGVRKRDVEKLKKQLQLCYRLKREIKRDND